MSNKGKKYALAFFPLMLAACEEVQCPFLCTDSAKSQMEYISAHDQCKQVAELKAGLQSSGSGGAADKATKTKVSSLFSECMSTNGWSVPVPSSTPAAAVAAAGAPAKTEPAQALPPISQKAQDMRLQRAAECAFMRQGAATSAIAKKRAEACDIECAQMARMAPDAPKSPACR